MVGDDYKHSPKIINDIISHLYNVDSIHSLFQLLFYTDKHVLERRCLEVLVLKTIHNRLNIRGITSNDVSTSTSVQPKSYTNVYKCLPYVEELVSVKFKCNQVCKHKVSNLI